MPDNVVRNLDKSVNPFPRNEISLGHISANLEVSLTLGLASMCNNQNSDIGSGISSKNGEASTISRQDSRMVAISTNDVKKMKGRYKSLMMSNN